MISHYGSEENLEQIYRQPYSTVGSDGIFGGRPHPRLWGSYPRYFGRYVRQRSLLSLEEAVHQVTLLPARILGIDDERGLLDVGRRADVVVFDPEAVKGCATYENPEQLSTGIRAVFVDGQLAWRGSEHSSGASEAEPAPTAFQGRVLRRGTTIG
jgi:N-acyl-D-amino-acid deacylase